MLFACINTRRKIQDNWCILIIFDIFCENKLFICVCEVCYVQNIYMCVYTYIMKWFI